MAERDLAGVRVLVVANEQVGAQMAGPAIRSSNLAAQLHDRGAAVTLATPRAIDGFDAAGAGYQNAAFGFPRAKRFRELAAAADVVVTQPQRVDVAWGLHRSGTPVVYDLYVPSFVERIAQLDAEPIDAGLKRRLLQRDQQEYAAAIKLGAGFICATQRQRDHWLGALGQAGRLDVGTMERERAGTSAVRVVPFGLPHRPPTPLGDAGGAIRGALVPDDSIVLLWTGGIWNWFDPVTLLEGFAHARLIEPRLRLVMLGLQHPEGAWDEQAAGAAMRSRAQQLGVLADGTLVLQEGWVPYDERHRYLLDADIAVSAHRDSLETRFSFRTRFLDHLWVGLPTLSTAGGDLTDEMAAAGAARSVPAGDAAAWSAAILELAADAELRRSMALAAAELGHSYTWPLVTAPLVDLVGRLAQPSATQDALPVTGRYRDVVGALALLLRVRIESKGIRSLPKLTRN